MAAHAGGGDEGGARQEVEADDEAGLRAQVPGASGTADRLLLGHGLGGDSCGGER